MERRLAAMPHKKSWVVDSGDAGASMPRSQSAAHSCNGDEDMQYGLLIYENEAIDGPENNGPAIADRED
jgi:hypothetical protein